MAVKGASTRLCAWEKVQSFRLFQRISSALELGATVVGSSVTELACVLSVC